MEQKKQTGTLGLFTLITIAVGQVVGAGVVSTTGVAIGATGRSVWLAYGLAVLVGFLIILPLILYSSVVRFRGSNYAVVSSLLGQKWGGIYSVLYLITMINGSTICSALGMYINSIFPFIDARIGGTAVITVFFILNLFGVKMMAGAQRIMTVLLLVALAMFVVAGIPHLQPEAFNFGTSDFITDGADGFLTAMVLLQGSCVGHGLTIAFSWDAKNPRKSIPLTLIITSAIIFVLYISVSFVAGNVLPVEQVAGKPLTDVARLVLPGPLFLVFIIGGPLLALSTTANAAYPSSTAPVYGGIRDGWMPAFLGKTNRFDMPWRLYLLKYLVTVVPVLVGFNLSELVANLVVISNGMKLIIIAAVFLMPVKFGEHWKKSWLHMPNVVFYPLLTFCLLVQIAVIALSAKEVPPVLMLINVVVAACLVAYALLRYKSGKTKINPVYEFED